MDWAKQSANSIEVTAINAEHNGRNIKSLLMSISLTNKNNADAKITMPSTYCAFPFDT